MYLQPNYSAFLQWQRGQRQRETGRGFEIPLPPLLNPFFSTTLLPSLLPSDTPNLDVKGNAYVNVENLLAVLNSSVFISASFILFRGWKDSLTSSPVCCRYRLYRCSEHCETIRGTTVKDAVEDTHHWAVIDEVKHLHSDGVTDELRSPNLSLSPPGHPQFYPLPFHFDSPTPYNGLCSKFLCFYNY